MLTTLALAALALALTRVAIGIFHYDRNIRKAAVDVIDEKTLLYLGVAGGLLLLQDVKSLAYGDLKLEFDQKLDEVRNTAENAQAVATGRGGQRTMLQTDSTFDVISSMTEIKPGEVVNDPWKGVFGRASQSRNRELTADIKQSGSPVSYRIHLRVVSSKPDVDPLRGTVQFFLHDTFSNDHPVVAVSPGGVAELILDAWGAFTVGAIADAGQTRLELDLAELNDAPANFRSR